MTENNTDSNNNIDILEIRINNIESKLQKPKSFGERLTVWGAALSLLISLLTGTFTVFDRLVSKPIEDKNKKIDQLEAAIGSINTINQELTTKILIIKDPNVVMAITVSANNQKAVLTKTAESIINSVSSEVGPLEYMVLGSEKMNSGDYIAARKYFQEAVSRKSDPSTHAEILRLQGRVLAMEGKPSGIVEARQAFASARQIMDGFINFGASGQRANLYSDEVVTEAYFGDCTLMSALVIKFDAELNKADVMPNIGQSLRSALALNLGNQTRCLWDRSVVTGIKG